MTSSASTVRLTFDYDWCTRSDTVDQCHLLLAARVCARSALPPCLSPRIYTTDHKPHPKPNPTIQVLAVATALLEAGAVVGALIMECRAAPGRRRSEGGSCSAEYACVALSTSHMVCAVLMLVVWSAVQDELKAQDLTSGVSKIHFGCVKCKSQSGVWCVCWVTAKPADWRAGGLEASHGSRIDTPMPTPLYTHSFSWWFFLLSAASTLLTDFCIIKILAASSPYTRVSPPAGKPYQPQRQPGQPGLGASSSLVDYRSMR